MTYSCDTPTGGLRRVYVCYRVGSDSDSILGLDLLSGLTINQDKTSATYGQVTVSSLSDSATTTGALFEEIQFNVKDGVSLFTDVVTVNADGSKEVVPTILVEVPVMSQDNTTAMAVMAQGNVELVAAVETAAGTYHLVGYDFGLYAATVDGTSGAGRTDKNRFLLTLSGSEAELNYTIASKSDFETLTGYTF